MKLVVFGLAISSSWGNGHATLWRGLCEGLARRGHRVEFFERDQPFYAEHRDYRVIPGGRLHLYKDWPDIAATAARALSDADAGIVTSFCPDAAVAETLLLESRAHLRVFYDLDAGVTLDRIARGQPVDYIGNRGLRDYDLVLSYTGGGSLDALRHTLGATRVEPLYGSVDPSVHRPVPPLDDLRNDLSYLGTWAADRQDGVEALFLEPARRLPARRFVLGGSQYPPDFPWTSNTYYRSHVTPDQHPAFYCSSRLTLNVTRQAMANAGFCPSGRLFEAAACGVPILSDGWPGLDSFFTPGREILVAHSADDAVRAVECSDEELRAIAAAARERVLAEHTADHRVRALERILAQKGSPGDVGDHSSRGRRHADSAAGVF